jgi:hypothetical protein
MFGGISMQIFILSRSRFNQLSKGRGTAFSIPDAWKQHTALVVPVSQLEQYRQAVHVRQLSIKIIPFTGEGLAAKRHFIGHIAEENSFLALDDDLKFQVHRDDFSDKLIPASNAEVSLMLEHVEDCLTKYVHVGIADRASASRQIGPGVLTTYNKRISGALGYRKTEYLACEHERVKCMQDFDLTLQLLRRGFVSACINRWCRDAGITQAPGGCSDYRTHEMHAASAHRLAELHPGFVRLVQKKNKTGGDFGTRTEVVISWKKAYESSQTLGKQNACNSRS